MSRNTSLLAAAAIALSLTATSCGKSADSGTTATETKTGTTSARTEAMTATSTSPAATSATGIADLQSLIPTPGNTERTDGPDSISDSGIRKHFVVAGSATSVMDAYKTALEGRGWTLTMGSSGGGGGGGGATYSGSNGDVYGVFSGGGYTDRTDVDACIWPSKPSFANCSHGN